MGKRVYLFLAVVAMLCTSIAYAQFEVGSIVGAVTDTTGSRIPGAVVEAKQMTTNSVRKTTSSSTGEYAFVGLQPGVYTVTVTQTGFAPQSREVNVAVSARVEANLSLGVGSASTTLEVTANSSSVALETGSSELGNVRSRDQVQGLPSTVATSRSWCTSPPASTTRATRPTPCRRGIPTAAAPTAP